MRGLKANAENTAVNNLKVFKYLNYLKRGIRIKPNFSR